MITDIIKGYISLNDTRNRTAERNMYGCLAESGMLGVTAEELEAFDDSTFAKAGVTIPPAVLDPRGLIDCLQGEPPDNAPPSDVATAKSAPTLFDMGGDSHLSGQAGVNFDYQVSNRRLVELVSLVIQAYADVRRRSSIDRVIAEPESNVSFLQRCWQLGAVASPRELNWTLFNARKSGMVSGLERSERFSIPNDRIDEIAFASEIALRCLQDRAFAEEQCDLSLDKLLCDPRLACEFDNLARRLAPGYSPLEYRWTAMTLRKARRLGSTSRRLPLFENLGRVDDLCVDRLPNSPGLYILRVGKSAGYVGSTDCLRSQVDRVVAALGPHIIPEWMAPHARGIGVLHILETPKMTFRHREIRRSQLLTREFSQLNFRMGPLFAQAA